MSRGKQRSSERIFLFTLVDLLLQMLFVFLALLLLVDEKGSQAAKAASDLQELQKNVGLHSVNEITEKWRRLSEAENACLQRKTELETKNKAYENRFGALGKPPCLCMGGQCNAEKPKPEFIATFELHDDGISLVPPPETAERTRLTSLLNRIFTEDDFRLAFKQFQRTDCKFYVHYEDKTDDSNKHGYKTWLQVIGKIFYASPL